MLKINRLPSALKECSRKYSNHYLFTKQINYLFIGYRFDRRMTSYKYDCRVLFLGKGCDEFSMDTPDKFNCFTTGSKTISEEFAT